MVVNTPFRDTDMSYWYDAKVLQDLLSGAKLFKGIVNAKDGEWLRMNGGHHISS